MIKKIRLEILITLLIPFNLFSWIFVPTQELLNDCYNRPDVILVASQGRSGSTLLTDAVENVCKHDTTLKSHILPPKNVFIGKILFIFSNPDKSAESALHKTLYSHVFGRNHFNNMESSDKEWLKTIKSTLNQTIHNNLLSYDALGYETQLDYWLYSKTKPC